MFLFALRHVLPAVVTLAGILVMIIGGNDNALEGGGAIVGAGLSIWLMNFLWRVGVTGDRERDVEDEARAYFDRHGYWPGEGPRDDAPAGPQHRTTPAHERSPRRGGSRRPLG
jgi:hypothetical protein